MSLNEIMVKPKQRGGGGGFWGSIGGAIGMVGGGLAGLAIGGPAGAAAGASLGGQVGAVGGTLGDRLGYDEPSASSGKKISTLKTMIQKDPMAQLAVMQNAKQQIAEASDIPAPQASQYLDLINKAQLELKNRLSLGRGNVG